MLKVKIILILSAFGFLFASSPLHAQWHEDGIDWKLKRDRNGIQVFLSKVSGSKFRAVMSVMEIEADPKQLAALVMDLENCPKWASMCKSAEVVERISPSESYVHSINNAPFPVRNRDVVSRVKWSYDDVSGKISMRSDATPDKLPNKRGLVRVQYASSEWHFTPKGDGMVLVENYAHVDPNGKVPAWIINMMIVESPFKTLKNMRTLILEGRYNNAKVAFLTDPQVDVN